MVTILSLWLPILLGAVLVFLANSVIHMLLPVHRNDYGKLPGEDRVLVAMREAGVSRGAYFFPHCAGPKEMQDPEVKKRFDAGPVGTMVVQGRGLPPIGKSLVQWFVYSIVIGVFVAYVATRTLPEGAAFLAVLQIAGVTAFLGYAGAVAHASIWWGTPWSITGKNILDGLVYGVVTGLAFAALWP